MFKLEIKTGGSAFRNPWGGEEDNYFEEQEVGRILRHVKNEVLSGKREGSIMDLNGNKVGTWSFD